MTSDFCQNIVIATDGSENSLKAVPLQKISVKDIIK